MSEGIIFPSPDRENISKGISQASRHDQEVIKIEDCIKWKNPLNELKNTVHLIYTINIRRIKVAKLTIKKYPFSYISPLQHQCLPRTRP